MPKTGNKPRQPAMDGNIEVESVASHFLDSGSFALWTRAKEYAIANSCGEWEFYDTDEFYQYLEGYAKFVKRYHKGIDLCANVDALPFRLTKRQPAGKSSHEISYRNIKLLEEFGIRPVPVVHLGADPNQWLRQYVEDGYKLIGLGGLVGSSMKEHCRSWVDRCFNFVCPDGAPIVGIHGFGVTAHEYLLRYPWFSVDSTTWTKKGGFGYIVVPKFKDGKFVLTRTDLKYDENWANDCVPWTVVASEENKARNQAGSMHYLVMPELEKRMVRAWLDEVGIKLGTEGGDWDGVITDHNQRRIVNLHFFERLREKIYKDRQESTTLWRSHRPVGFGLHEYAPVNQPAKMLPMNVPAGNQPIIYYSGCASIASQPEVVLGRRANIMLTYYDFHKANKPDARFRRVLKARGHKFK